MNKPKNILDPSTLTENEYHPAADSAMAWLRAYKAHNWAQWARMQESIASSALTGNRLAEVLFGTIERMKNGEPVSDRYLFGLCWFLRNSEETK